jgi:hypothetical protein
LGENCKETGWKATKLCRPKGAKVYGEFGGTKQIDDFGWNSMFMIVSIVGVS